MELHELGYKNEIYFYVEKYNGNNNYVLVDFVDSNEMSFFNSISTLNYEWEKKPTMIELVNYTQKKLQEGVTYRMSLSALMQLVGRIELVQDSLIIGFKLNVKDIKEEIFGQSKSFNQFERFERNMDDTNSSDISNLDIKFNPIDKVIIKNIGQGNWNELVYNEKFEIVFDFGTIYTTKRTNVIRLIGNRDIEYQKCRPLFILSHWDVDHYHFLLGFDDNTIRSIPKFIYRSAIPNLTSRKALGRFKVLNRNSLLPIAVDSPYPRRSSIELRNINLTLSGNIILHNAFKNRSRNKSGIGLTVRREKSCVILSGDYDYKQISDYILPILNYKCKHYLIVPHHGGKAGRFIYKNSTLNVLEDAVISVGPNPYQPPHPHTNNINELKRKGFSVKRTDILLNDYEIIL